MAEFVSAGLDPGQTLACRGCHHFELTFQALKALPAPKTLHEMSFRQFAIAIA